MLIGWTQLCDYFRTWNWDVVLGVAQQYAATHMRMTIELPDELVRETKAAGAGAGKLLRDFVTEAIREKLRLRQIPAQRQPHWCDAFGALRDLPTKEHSAIRRRIDEQFGRIDASKW